MASRKKNGKKVIDVVVKDCAKDVCLEFGGFQFLVCPNGNEVFRKPHVSVWRENEDDGFFDLVGCIEICQDVNNNVDLALMGLRVFEQACVRDWED